jgi:hypothetical protein
LRQTLRTSFTLTFTSDKHHFFVPLILRYGICKYELRSAINRDKSIDKYGTALIAITRIAGFTVFFSHKSGSRGHQILADWWDGT